MPTFATKLTDQEIAERRSGMGAAADPSTDHIIALGNEIGSAGESEVWKRFTESGHEGFDIGVAATRLMKRILQKHVGSGELIDNLEIAVFAPEIGEPATDEGFVVVFFAHDLSFSFRPAEQPRS